VLDFSVACQQPVQLSPRQ